VGVLLGAVLGRAFFSLFVFWVVGLWACLGVLCCGGGGWAVRSLFCLLHVLSMRFAECVRPAFGSMCSTGVIVCIGPLSSDACLLLL
jgi:hypothetical protein